MDLPLDPIGKLIDQHYNNDEPHWPGCYTEHLACAARALVWEVENYRVLFGAVKELER